MNAHPDLDVINDPALIRSIANDSNFDRDFSEPVSSSNRKRLAKMLRVFSVGGRRFPTMCPRTDADRAASQGALWAKLDAIAQGIKSGPEELEPLAQ
jgi:hypothetical protein